MRILFVITALGVGGAELEAIQIARELHRRGWAVEIAAMIDPYDLPSDVVAGLAVSSLGIRRGAPDPRAVWRLAAVLRRTRPVVVHSHMFHANLLARLTRIVSGMPVLISTIHSVYESSDVSHTDVARETLYRLTDPLAERTTAVCRAAAEHLLATRAVRAEKLAVIPNGIDTRRFRPDSEARSRIRAELSLGTAFVWLAMGRLIPVKDYPALVAAFAILCQSYPDSRLLIAGDGDQSRFLADEIARRGLAGSVRLLGIRSDTPALMNAADGYVLSSRNEGLPLVLLEASATGLPIVATRAGGCEEVVESETGVLVDPGRPDLLAAAMQAIMGLTPEQRSAMGRRGRERAERHYDLRTVVDRWEELYFEEIAAHAGACA